MGNTVARAILFVSARIKGTTVEVHCQKKMPTQSRTKSRKSHEVRKIVEKDRWNQILQRICSREIRGENFKLETMRRTPKQGKRSATFTTGSLKNCTILLSAWQKVFLVLRVKSECPSPSGHQCYKLRWSPNKSNLKHILEIRLFHAFNLASEISRVREATTWWLLFNIMKRSAGTSR